MGTSLFCVIMIENFLLDVKCSARNEAKSIEPRMPMMKTRLSAYKTLAPDHSNRLVFCINKNNRTSTDGKTGRWQPHYPTKPTIMKTKRKLKKCKYIVEINI